MRRIIAGWMLISCLFVAQAENPKFLATPVSSKSFGVLEDNKMYLDFELAGYGPGWSYIAIRGELSGSGDLMTAKNNARSGGANISIKVQAEPVDEQTIQLTYNTSSSKSIPVLMITSGLNFSSDAFKGGRILVTSSDGETKEVMMPLDKSGLGESVQSCTLIDARGRETIIQFDPACGVASDNQARILLAADRIEEPSELVVTLTLPGDVDFYSNPDSVPFEPGFDQWFAFTPSTDFSKESEIGMQDWLEKPAGKHGRITRQNDKLIYNKKPIRLWGLNLNYNGCAPQRPVADRRAALYAKYGINAVRLHKYGDGNGWQGILKQYSFLEFDPAALDRMDYFVSRLKEAGIYVKLSSTFGVKVGRNEYDMVPYIDEIGSETRVGRIEAKHGSIWLSKELQDMQIQQVVSMLEHKNPHTGERYADDPVVAVVELFNEDSALFFGTMVYLQKSPTLRKRASEQFTDWLEGKYGSEQALLEAWGGETALNCFVNEGFTDESWEARSIVPAGSPWFYDPDQLNGAMRDRKQRLLDTMEFLYHLQNEFYDRYVEAIRETGYEGEIMASNWQAGRAFSHYYNLHSDYRIGLIDRHNYFGGGSQTVINNNTMLHHPGSGLFSSGMQQVSDRPFSLSEWIHRQPTEWALEGPAIIGTYGMGLQGWDISFIFQNSDDGKFVNELNKSIWTGIMTPHALGFFPAISRQVLRGDVQESDVNATRYVHVPSLNKGILDFDENVTQVGDVKSFSGDTVPDLALAAARCVVEFTDEPKNTPVFDIEAYKDENGTIRSSTGELAWTPGEKKLDGFFTVDTPAAKAVVGFAGGKSFDLGGITIEPHSRFGAIYVIAQNPDDDLASGKTALVVAIARSRNTDMNVLADKLILTQGRAPIVMEPVKASIKMNRSVKRVELLDHDGLRTGEKIPVKNRSFEIDGSRDQTCYYLIEF